MRRQGIVAVIVLTIALPSAAVARGGYSGHSNPHSSGVRSAPVYRSVPVYRAPVYRAGPVYRQPVQSRAPSVTYHRATSSVIHVPYAIQHSRSLTVVRTSPVWRPAVHHVRVHGGLLALPALATIGIPVFLDVPEIGVVSIDEDAYAAIYPLLTSENEADRERAFVQLREQRDRAPTVVDSADVPPSAYERGKAALDRGEFDAAIVEFTATISNDPKDPFSYIRRGTAYERKGDAASAIGDYRMVLKLVDADTGADYAAKIRRLEKTRK